MSCNTCAICLDSVTGGQPIGSVYPCGHVFHVECWDGWVASQRSGQTKCAMCNRQSQGFSRLYLDFLATNDDDNSLSSCSDASITGEDDADELTSLPETERDSTNGDNVDQDNTPGSSSKNALAVDEDEPPNSTFDKSKVDKYKKISKQLKQQNQYLMAELTTSRKDLEEAEKSYNAELKKRNEFEREIQLLKEDFKYTHLELHGANLEATCLKRRLVERESSLNSTMASLQSLKISLEKLQKTYNEDIKRARAASTTEVRRMLLEYPKVKEENRELKALLSAVDFDRVQKGTDGKSFPKANPPVSSKRKRSMLKELDQTTSTKTAKLTDRKADEKEEEIQQCLQKSSCAALLSRTFQAKRRHTPLDLLNSNVTMQQSVPLHDHKKKGNGTFSRLPTGK